MTGIQSQTKLMIPQEDNPTQEKEPDDGKEEREM